MGITRRLFISLTAAFPFASARAVEPAAGTVKIHFLHHSTGGNLVQGAGGISKMFRDYNQEHGVDYRFSEEWSSPQNDNYPYEYFTQTFTPEQLAKYAGQYHVVIWKHCYPGSAILPDDGNPGLYSARKSLESYKLQYRALRSRFDSFPGTKFMVWTLPPLHRNATDPDSAKRAAEFSNWVRTEFLVEDGVRPNLGCFDFRGEVADEDNFLRWEYEPNHEGSDSHPNALANDTVCPVFFNSIISFVRDQQTSAGEQVPEGFRVGPALPNPFNPVTVIEYRAPVACRAKLTVHDALGRTVAVLHDGTVSAGVHRAVWNGRDQRGNPVASGTYFFSMRAGAYRGQGKMTLLR